VGLVGAALNAKQSLALLATLLVAVVLGIGIGPEAGPALWVATAFTAVAVFAILAVIYQTLKVVNNATDAHAATARDQALQELGKAQDLSARIAANQKVRALWEDMARRQASTSYTYSQIALAAGPLVLLIGTGAVLLSADFASQAVIGGLAAIGGAISGSLAQTIYREIATSVLRTSGESVWVAAGRRDAPIANAEPDEAK